PAAGPCDHAENQGGARGAPTVRPFEHVCRCGSNLMPPRERNRLRTVRRAHRDQLDLGRVYVRVAGHVRTPPVPVDPSHRKMVFEVPTQVTHNRGVAWQTSTPFTINFTGGSYPCCAVVTITSPALLTSLNTLVQENKSRLLANPRLAVRDGETAKMNIGDKIPFQVVNAQGVPSVVIIEAGVQLEVTPRVTSDGFVTLKMHPEVSTIKTPPGPNVPP